MCAILQVLPSSFPLDWILAYWKTTKSLDFWTVLANTSQHATRTLCCWPSTRTFFFVILWYHLPLLFVNTVPLNRLVTIFPIKNGENKRQSPSRPCRSNPWFPSERLNLGGSCLNSGPKLKAARPLKDTAGYLGMFVGRGGWGSHMLYECWLEAHENIH